VTPDRVAEALAALEAAGKALEDRDTVARLVALDAVLNEGTSPVEIPAVHFSEWSKAQQLVLGAVPALLKLARDYHHLEWDSPLLDELAQAVLGPEPGQ